MKAQLRSTTAAVALGLLATGAYAMTPLEQAGRGYHEGERAHAGTFEKADGGVQSRTFDGTRQLESSGRGSALDKSGSSAANESAAGVNASGDASRLESGYGSTGFQQGSNSTSQSIDEQVAANQDAYDWTGTNSEIAGSGYTSDSDLNAGTEERAVVQGDKLVVIVPEGRVPELIAALEQSSAEPATVVTNGDASDPAMIEAHPSNLE